jgi:hypothetical protein
MARRLYIESQLTPVTQAFGFEGGWGVERRKKGKLAELRAQASETPPWPCAARGCKKLIRWEPTKYCRRFRKYCSPRCRARQWAWEANRRLTPEQLARAREKWREKTRNYYREHRTEMRAYARAYSQRRSPEQIERNRERMRRWQQTEAGQLAASRRRTPEYRARELERQRERYRKLTPEQYERRLISQRKRQKSARWREYNRVYQRAWRRRKRAAAAAIYARKEGGAHGPPR